MLFFHCVFVFFHSNCSHAQVLGTTLVHELPIFNRNTQWSLLYRDSCGEIVLSEAEASPIKI